MNYALYLLLQLSSSFYVFQVLRKLPKGAEKILVFMGYNPTTQDMQELKYEGDVNTERVLETAADLVILHSELDLIKELLQLAINKSQCDTYVANFVTLHKILDARALTDEKYDDTWKYLMKAAYTLQSVRNLFSQPRKLSSERPSFDITAYENRAPNQFLDARQDYCRGSSPVLNQWPDNQTSASNQPTVKHKQCSPQEVKVVQTPGATPVKVHTSVSSRSFQKELRNLYKQFPALMESQDEGPAPSDPTYQNTGDVLQLEEAEKPQESLALNLPEPVAQSEAELEQLERYRQNQSGLMSINPGIKDARSVIDDDGVGPCYGSLSPPDRSLAHTPSTQDQQDINEAWTVRTETHHVAQFFPSTSDRLPSDLSSGTEDIYENF